ncbi:MAG TPA: terminase family protein [Nevskiales bacterium]|nr:terminase family protein [Nevskiales bacterium]
MSVNPRPPLEPRHNRTPAAFLPYQQRWAADKAQVKVIEKSRRVGLSWGEAADSVLEAASERGQDVWYIGYTKDMAQEFILDCAEWAKHFHSIVSEIEDYEEVFEEGNERQAIQAFRIKFDSGYRIVALSSRPRNLRGKQGRIIIDEAAFHDDLAGLLKAALAMLMWGGSVHIISTHNGEDNPFNELIQEIRAGKKPYSLHRITFEDAVREGLYQRVCLRTGKKWTAEDEAAWVAQIRAQYGEDAAEELDCIPARGGGIWLSRVLIEARMADLPVVRYTAPDGMDLWAEHLLKREVLEFCESELDPLLKKLDPRLASFIGGDFARSGDLAVYAPGQLQRDLVRKFPFLLELRNVPFKAQEQIVFYICDRLPRFSHGKFDARGNGQYLAEVVRARYGEGRIDAVMLSETWYRENTAPLKAAFEDGTIELPADADTLNDLAAFRLVKGVPRIPESRTTGKDGGKRHGDAGIAVLLAYAASREDPYQQFEYHTVNAERTVRDFMRPNHDDDIKPLGRGGGFKRRKGVI